MGGLAKSIMINKVIPSETSKKFGALKKSIKTAEWVQREAELTQKILKAMGKE